MNIVADENIDVQIIERLLADRHSVLSVAEFEPGIEDEAVLRESRETLSILLTADKDFGELVFRQGLVHSGVVLCQSLVSSDNAFLPSAQTYHTVLHVRNP